MSSTKVLTTTPRQYMATVAQRDTESLTQDIAVFRSFISRLAELRKASRSAQSIGAGWTTRALMEAHDRAAELAETTPKIIPVYRKDDAALVFAEGREGLDDDLVRVLFEQCESLRFEGAAHEAVGVGMVPAGRPLREWWARGHGSPKLRNFLAKYAIGEAAVEDVNHWELAPLWADVAGLAVHVGNEHVAQAAKSNQYALIDESESPQGVIATFETSDEQLAREQAVAAVNETRNCVALANLYGVATMEKIEGAAVYRGIVSYSLKRDCESHAAESLINRAVESFTMPRCGRVIRVHENENGAMSWDVVVIEAGLGFNNSFYLRDLLEDKLATAMSGRPVEEIFIDSTNLDHLPDDVFHRYPDGVTGVVVGQLTDVRFEDEGGMVPPPDVVNVLSESLKLTPAEVIEQASGRIVATLEFDNNSRGRDAHAMVQGAHERGLLAEHPQLSIDFNEAPFIAIWHEGREIAVRRDVNDAKRMTISMVNKGAQGGRFLDRKAA